MLDAHEAVADRRPPRARRRARSSAIEHVLCDIRDARPRSRRSRRAPGPTSSSTSPPTSTSTGPSATRRSSSTRTSHGSWNVLRAAEAAGVGHGRRRLDRQGGARRELLRAHEALHGAAHRVRRARAPARDRTAVRLRERARQRRQRLRAVPAPGARRRAADRHRHRDAALLDHDGARRARSLAHGALLAARGRAARRRRRPGRCSPSASSPQRIWRAAAAPARPPTSTCSASAAARR